MKNLFLHVKSNFQVYWHIAVVAALTVYIFINWAKAVDFVFFDEFNGVNLLFITWLLLLILPCIGKFEGFGVKMESPFNAPLAKRTEALSTQEEVDKSDITNLEKGLLLLKDKKDDGKNI